MNYSSQWLIDIEKCQAAINRMLDQSIKEQTLAQGIQKQFEIIEEIIARLALRQRYNILQHTNSDKIQRYFQKVKLEKKQSIYKNFNKNIQHFFPNNSINQYDQKACKEYFIKKRRMINKLLDLYRKNPPGSLSSVTLFIKSIKGTLVRCIERSDLQLDIDKLCEVYYLMERIKKDEGFLTIDIQFIKGVFSNYLDKQKLMQTVDLIFVQQIYINTIQVRLQIDQYQLAQIFCKFQLLEKISFRNKMGNKGLQTITKSIRMENLKLLSLFGNLIDENGIRILSKCQLNQLKTLSLSKNLIKNKGLLYLAKANMPKLQKLLINLNCYFTMDALKTIAKGNWPCLKQLYVIGDSQQIHLPTMTPVSLINVCNFSLK